MNEIGKNNNKNNNYKMANDWDLGISNSNVFKVRLYIIE